MADDEAQLSRLQSLAASFAVGDPACLFPLEETLNFLLARTRSPAGRQALGGHGAAKGLLNLVPMLGAHSPELKSLWVGGDISHEKPADSVTEGAGGFVLRPLLLLLRVLRNLCAGEKLNQDAFLDGGVEQIARLLTALAQAEGYGQVSASGRDQVDVVRAALQLLGNVSGGGEGHQSAIWAACFPDAFLQLSKCPLEEVQGPLCMLLFQCCRQSEVRRAQLCIPNEKAASLLQSLFKTARKDDSIVPGVVVSVPLQPSGVLDSAGSDALALPQAEPVHTASNVLPIGTSNNSQPRSENTLPTSYCPPSPSESSVLTNDNRFPPSEPMPTDVNRPAASQAVQASVFKQPQSSDQQSLLPASDSPEPTNASRADDAVRELAPGYGGGEWLEYLVDLLCLQHPLLAQVFAALSSSRSRQGIGGGVEGLGVEKLKLETDSGFREQLDAMNFGAEHVTLLSITLHALRQRIDSEETSTFTLPAPSAVFLLKLVVTAARQCATESLRQAPGSLNSQTSAHATAPPSRGESAADASNGASETDGFEAAEMELRRAGPLGANTSTGSKSQLPPALPTGRPAVDLLGLSLRMLSAVCASRKFGPPAIGGQKDAISALLKGGLVSILLDLLRALGLPERLRGKGGPRRGAVEAQGAMRGNGELNEVPEANGSKPASSELGAGQLTSDREPSRGWSSKTIPSSSHPPTLDEASQPSTSWLPDAYPDRSPYLGYRRDVVAVLANASHRNPQVQVAVREGGGAAADPATVRGGRCEPVPSRMGSLCCAKLVRGE